LKSPRRCTTISASVSICPSISSLRHSGSSRLPRTSCRTLLGQSARVKWFRYGAPWRSRRPARRPDPLFHGEMTRS
jgi:hypothetical protein